MIRFIAATLCVFALAGCSSTPAYTADAAASLQTAALQVTQSSADSDFAGAAVHLAELRAAADAALARGDITEERHRSIQSSADLVQSDLDASIAAAEQAAADAAAAQAAAEKAAAEQAAAEKAAAEQAAAEKAAAEQAAAEVAAAEKAAAEKAAADKAADKGNGKAKDKKKKGD